MYLSELKSKIVDNDYCIGCGACAYLSKESISMEKNMFGQIYANIDVTKDNQNPDILAVCPFYNHKDNEDELSKKLFSNQKYIKHNEFEGYYVSNYAGYVIRDNFRDTGSSGGFTSWIAAKLLSLKKVDRVIHVRPSTNNDKLFSYQISATLEEVKDGAKSRYYPIEMSEILNYIQNNDYRYLVIGLPCFLKSIRLLQKKDKLINERVKYTVGLVCGHLKSDFFAKSMAWEMGINPRLLTNFDFRVKKESSSADDYSVRAFGYSNGELLQKESATKDLFSSNWGYGFFKYNACDYCDDVLGELADVTVGDAWLPKYVKDYKGTNILIVRNSEIDTIISTFTEEIFVEKISEKDIINSQASGLRHRRIELSYRLYLKDANREFRPIKRVEAHDDFTNKRKKIQKYRLKLTRQSYDNFHLALINNDYSIFKKKMKRPIMKYKKLYSDSIMKKIYDKAKSIFKSCISK